MKTGIAALVILVALAAGYEIFALVTKVPGATLSERVWRLSEEHPIVPFLAGLLAGHLFWRK